MSWGNIFRANDHDHDNGTHGTFTKNDRPMIYMIHIGEINTDIVALGMANCS